MKRLLLIVFLFFGTATFAQQKSGMMDSLDATMRTLDSMSKERNRKLDSSIAAQSIKSMDNNMSSFVSMLQERERKQKQQMWMRFAFAAALIIIAIIGFTRRRKQKQQQ